MVNELKINGKEIEKFHFFLLRVDRKQDVNVLYQVCVFEADRKNKMAALASD